MEMSLKQSTLVLLTVAVLVVSGQEHVDLDHREKTVDVAIGSSLTLHCKLKTEKYERFRVHWEFLPSSGPNSSQIIHKDLVDRSAKTSNRTTAQQYHWETYIIANVTDKNSGSYHCKVIEEIPGFENVQSKKTQVVIAESLMETTAYPSVLTRKQATPNLVPEFPKWWMWMVLCLSILALFILLLICAVLRRRCRRRQEDPIYANTRPVAKQPSPRPGAPASNNLKAVPSSVNLRPPSPRRNSYKS
ncbi:hypothetical protein JOB18_019409 [Solea senegalensis]|uniref:Ig-like domain-containing protein n=1 Tax=Solea senegalensis TaxID=28829 RepID=A0AAV6S9J6_SOLSE|nr:uncharacterized protein LOC122780495 isoform X1 [Solea senegalensis]KAG7513889.1 hypothetical protein JOB18_019409 [Solea senegalensis]